MIFLIAYYTLKLRFFATFVRQMAGEMPFMLVIFVAVDAEVSPFVMQA